jgi:hypothetical protein
MCKIREKIPRQIYKKTQTIPTLAFIQHETQRTKKTTCVLDLAGNKNFAQNPLIILARIWNQLPDSIKAIENYNLF